MREGEHTGEYLWLRQTVTVTADGQTRTLEMAIPVRPGATAEEIAALRAQAIAGMAQLSQALDEAVATAFTGSAPTLTPAASTSTIPAVTSAPPAAATGVPSMPRSTASTPPSAAQPGTSAPPTLREAPAPAATSLTRSAATASTEPPARGAAAPASSGAQSSAAPSRPASSPISPAASAVSPSGSTPSPSPTPAPAAARPANAPAATTNGAPMNRQEFLSTASQLGLNPKQVMDRLGVRSLEGLNLREALEALRRQMLRGEENGSSAEASAAPSAAPPASSSSVSPSVPPRTPPSTSARPAPSSQSVPTNARSSAGAASAPSRPSSPPGPAPHFDEEIDAEFEYHISDEGLDDEFGGRSGDDIAVPGAPDYAEYADNGYEAGASAPTMAAGDLGNLDGLMGLDDEDDVPDFSAGASHTSAPPARQAPPASRGNSSTRASATSAGPAPRATSANPVGEATGGGNITQLRAVELIKRMRATPTGGNTSDHQWKAYKNIVLGELADAEARMLVQGLWRVPPEKLSADQLDELISWGKRDDFADDARLVLAELATERRAERERAMGSASGETATANRPESPIPPSSTRTRARTPKREADDSAES